MLMVRLGRDDYVAYVNVDKIIHMYSELSYADSAPTKEPKTRIILDGLSLSNHFIVQGTPDEVQAQINEALRAARISEMTP